MEPDSGWSDPLKSYFSSFAGFMGGGLINFEFLSETPIRIALDLNEWVRFELPGKYRVQRFSYSRGRGASLVKRGPFLSGITSREGRQ